MRPFQLNGGFSEAGIQEEPRGSRLEAEAYAVRLVAVEMTGKPGNACESASLHSNGFARDEISIGLLRVQSPTAFLDLAFELFRTARSKS